MMCKCKICDNPIEKQNHPIIQIMVYILSLHINRHFKQCSHGRVPREYIIEFLTTQPVSLLDQ